jgi:hypothetical protein
MLAGTAVIAIALCGAYCTHRWVEQPINRSTFGKQTPWHGLAMGVGLAVPVLAISTVWLLLNEAEKNRQREAAERIMAQYTGGAAPMSLETAWTPGVPVYPTPRAVRHKHPNHCQQKETKSEVLSCSYGVVEGARKTIALVGGSHAEHWLPALEKLAHEYKWRIVAITKSACALIPNRGHQSCVQWNNDIDEALVRLRPDVVFTTSTRRGNPSGASIEYVPEAYLKYWADWEKNNITVIAIRDSARTRKDAFECIERSPVDLKKCSMPRKDLFDQIDPTSRLNPKPANVSFIDLTDRFCDLELCSPVGGNVLVYRDTHHITIEYSRTLADPLGERMKQVRPDLFLMEARDNSPRHQSADAGEGLEGTAVKQH